GYPVLIAAVTPFVGDCLSAALWISRFSLIAMPVVSYWLFRPMIGQIWAVLLGILTMSSLGMLVNAGVARSDAPFALIALVSSGLLLRGLSGDAPTVFLAGFLCGVSILIRNAAVALLISEFLCIFACGILTSRTARSMLLQSYHWTIGAAVP